MIRWRLSVFSSSCCPDVIRFNLKRSPAEFPQEWLFYMLTALNIHLVESAKTIIFHEHSALIKKKVAHFVINQDFIPSEIFSL